MPQLAQLIAGGMEGECKQIRRQQQIGQALMSVAEVVLHMIAIVFQQVKEPAESKIKRPLRSPMASISATARSK